MFARIVSEYQIDIASRCIHVGNKTYVLPTPEQYAEAGYYEVIEGKKLEPRKWYHVVTRYTQEKNNILQSFEYEKDDKPLYDSLVVSHIREKYSINDELAILRQGLSGSKKGDFDEYNKFCEECKNTATKELEEWEKA